MHCLADTHQNTMDTGGITYWITNVVAHLCEGFPHIPLYQSNDAK